MEGSVPCYNAQAFDTPYNSRASYDKELRNMLKSGIIEPMGFTRISCISSS